MPHRDIDILVIVAGQQLLFTARMLDLDADGDRDVVTCEERDNLGVIWYENPSR